jgi:DNA-binding CsgD family transcriptional regulator
VRLAPGLDAVTGTAQRLLASLLAIAAAEGVAEELLAIPAASAAERANVDTVVAAASRLAVALGGPGALLEAATRTSAWPELAVYAHPVATPRELVLAAWDGLLCGPRAVLALGCPDRNRDPLVLTARLPRGRALRGGLDMLLAGAIRTVPLFYELAPAHVEVVGSNTALELHVTLPPAVPQPIGARSARLQPSMHLTPVVGMLGDRWMARARSVHTTEAARVLGEGLGSARSSEDVATITTHVLTQYLDFSLVRLWAGPTVRERRLLASAGGSSGTSPASTSVLPLSARNEALGLLEVDLHGDIGFAHTLLPWVSGELHRRFVAERGPARNVEPIDRAWGLTTRQAEVAALVGQGLANKEIALAIGCSCATVEEHLTAVYRKAGVTGRGPLLAALLGASARAS